MVTWRGRVAFVLLSLAAPACFDVQTVDPGVLLVDDFDDGDFLPAMPELGYWQCYTSNPPTNRDYRCDHKAESPSGDSLFVEFALADVPNGQDLFPGVGFLSVGENGARVDLTPYRELVISMKLENGNSPLPSEARVHVSLQCKPPRARPAIAAASGLFLCHQPGCQPAERVVPKPFPLRIFGPPPDTTQHIKGGVPACLRAVDGISIALEGGLKDGQSGQGQVFHRRLEVPVRRRHAGLALMLMTLPLTNTACFDVRIVDPGPAVLDDFEDRDLIPAFVRSARGPAPNTIPPWRSTAT